MLMFTHAISCLTTSNLPWFRNLIFQVPMQHCSLQPWTLLPSPVTSTTGSFCFGSVSPFFLELFLHWSPVAYWAPPDLGSSSFSVLPFCFFILFMRFSKQEYSSGLPFPSPVYHVLSEPSNMTHPSWVALHGMVHRFIELDKAVVHVIRLVSSLWLWFSFACPLINQSVQSLSRVRLFATPWTAARQAYLSITNSWNLPKLMLSRWCHLTISTSVIPFSSCLKSFSTSGSLQMSQLFPSGGQSIGASASTSVLPMNTQDWSA